MTYGVEGNNVVIRVKVLPRSSKNQIVAQEDGILKVKVTAPPVEGEANKRLKNLLAKSFGRSKGSIDIISGERSRTKLIRIRGLSPVEMNRALEKVTISC